MSAVGTFNTQDVNLGPTTQPKTSKTINFPKTYVAPPHLAIGLNAFDVKPGNAAIVRVKAYADGIDTQKCTMHAETWDDTTLYMAGMDYLIKKPGDLEFQFGEFNTEDDHPVTKPQARTTRRIDFERPYVTPPKVVAFFKSFDVGGSSTRIRIGISGVDAKGFTMTIESWADTTLYRAIAGWVAYPEDKEHIFSGTATTMDVRAWDHPQAKQEKDVSFEGVSFWKKPSVFVAFNWLDISTARNPRVRAYVDNVDKGGMTWHIDSWADTEVWVAGISYIAFN